MIAAAPAQLRARFARVRGRTTALAEPLASEDMVVQSMPDVSPTKWHLAHVTWWFERFLLAEHVPGYRPFDPRFEELFNSYYLAAGDPWTRADRGLLSRPTVSEVLAYRRAVDASVDQLLAGPVDERSAFLVEVGLAHEEQHQELLLMDIKHVFSLNPLAPAYVEPVASRMAPVRPADWIAFEGGVCEVGAEPDGSRFTFDNETPRHEVLVRDFELADRLVTNGEFLQFVEDGGYRRPELWLSDGWTWLQEESVEAPAYWCRRDDGAWEEFTLGGLRALAPAAPVVHVSHFEADAYARWAGARLPTEVEWEVAAQGLAADEGRSRGDSLHPEPAGPEAGLRQMFGAVWQWTASPYVAYPGFQTFDGMLGEYNGKFMSSQLVLRGSACVTPRGHARSTYRNFFYPRQRWQFAGVRLAR